MKHKNLMNLYEQIHFLVKTLSMMSNKNFNIIERLISFFCAKTLRLLSIIKNVSNFIFKIINLFPLLFLRIFSNFNFLRNILLKRRSFAIRSYFTTTIKILRNFNFDNNIIISPKNGNFVETDDVRLSFEKFNRHLKSIGASVNEGNYCKKFFQKINLEPHVIIDIGANVGEISLFLNKNFPNAKIYALEPSSENFEVISKNISKSIFLY